MNKTMAVSKGLRVFHIFVSLLLVLAAVGPGSGSLESMMAKLDAMKGQTKRHIADQHIMELHENDDSDVPLEEEEPVPCTCGVFLSGQIDRRHRKAPPRGDAALTMEADGPSLPCGLLGLKNCINKCLDTVIKHLPQAGPLICGSLDRDCVKEKAFLFIKNCDNKWINTNFSAGKDFCCKDGEHYKCSELLKL